MHPYIHRHMHAHMHVHTYTHPHVHTHLPTNVSVSQVSHLNGMLLSYTEDLHMIETALYSRLSLLKQFYHKWHDFKLWLNDTRHLLKSSVKSLTKSRESTDALPNPEELTRLQVCVSASLSVYIVVCAVYCV